MGFTGLCPTEAELNTQCPSIVVIQFASPAKYNNMARVIPACFPGDSPVGEIIFTLIKCLGCEFIYLFIHSKLSLRY